MLDGQKWDFKTRAWVGSVPINTEVTSQISSSPTNTVSNATQKRVSHLHYLPHSVELCNLLRCPRLFTRGNASGAARNWWEAALSDTWNDIKQQATNTWMKNHCSWVRKANNLFITLSAKKDQCKICRWKERRKKETNLSKDLTTRLLQAGTQVSITEHTFNSSEQEC